LRELIALIQSTRMPVVPIDRRRLEDATAALKDLREGRVVGRVVMIP
jgi:D-arabinose 1-dehydrogenase-like Zn-dependent alcohol dehydrogenase